MVSYAKCDDNNTVIEVTNIYRDFESEEQALEFLIKFSYGHQNWKRVYESHKHFPTGGFKWDEDRQQFIPPQPHSSWTLSEESLTWMAPVIPPNFIWSEELQDWVKEEISEE